MSKKIVSVTRHPILSLTMKKLIISLALCVTTIAVDAALAVKVDSPATVGTKTIVKLTIKNTFSEKVESARAQVFLTDDNGKIVGQAVQWVIGGKKDRPPLAPDASVEFNFVIQTDKPFKTAKVSFIRVLLEGGKGVDVKQNVQIQE